MTLVVGVDVGGTFTDLCAVGPEGPLRVAKVPSSHPEPAEAILRGIDRICTPEDTVTRTILGTTAGLNAVLERRGARTALVATEGFADVYRMARGDRTRIYDLHYRRPAPLVGRSDTFEVRERITAQGDVLEPLSEPSLERLIVALRDGGYESVAICLLNAYVNGHHERLLRQRIEAAIPGLYVSISSDVAPEWREYERTSTTVVDAYVRPILDRHVSRLMHGLEERGHQPNVEIMRASGGTMPVHLTRIEPATVLTSGPVAGAIASARLAARLGIANGLAVDMGGTSFDMTILRDGRLHVAGETSIEGFPLLVAAVHVDTIGAGGGAVVWLEGGGVRVGPRSAGAYPGPICFGRGGGEPTVTDANACLGRIAGGTFASGTVDLDVPAATARYASLAGDLSMTGTDLIEGVVAIVDARMVEAIRAITVERGLDVRTFSLLAYGGNGPLHVAALAELLGIVDVVVPPSPGAFSARGMLFADLRKDYATTVIHDLDPGDPDALTRTANDLTDEARHFLSSVASEEDRVTFAWRASVRYVGQEHAVDVDLPEPPFDRVTLDHLRSAFHANHARRYGYAHEGGRTELVTLRLAVTVATGRPEIPAPAVEGSHPTATRSIRYGGRALNATVMHRDAVVADARFEGPCIIEESTATTLVPPGWTVRLAEDGVSLRMRRGAS